MTSSSGNLGRGLDDLFASPPAPEPVFATSARRFTPLFIDHIDAPALSHPVPEGLVESIRRHGVLSPVLVRSAGDRYVLIAGAERLQAAADAGLREIPACLVEADDSLAAELADAESCQHPAPQSMGKASPDDPRPPDPSPPRRNLIPIFTSAFVTAALMILLGWWLGWFDPAPVQTAGNGGMEDAPPAHSLEEPALMLAAPTPEPASAAGPILEPAPTREPAPAPAPTGPDWLWLQGLQVDGVVVMDTESSPIIRFEAGVFRYRDVITADSQGRLRALGRQLLAGPDDILVVIAGHTDDDPVSPGGAYRDNRDIGMARAVAVADFLTRETGLASHRVLATSSGAVNPPYPNRSPDEKRKNRTVTLTLMAPRAGE